MQSEVELSIKHIKQVIVWRVLRQLGKNDVVGRSACVSTFPEQEVPWGQTENHWPVVPPLCSAVPSALPGGAKRLRPTLVVTHAHGAVTLVVGDSSTEGTVHRYLKIVGSQAVAVSVRIGEKAAL